MKIPKTAILCFWLLFSLSFFISCEIHDTGNIPLMPEALDTSWQDTIVESESDTLFKTTFDTIYQKVTPVKVSQQSLVPDSFSAQDTLNKTEFFLKKKSGYQRSHHLVIKWLSQDSASDTLTYTIDSLVYDWPPDTSTYDTTTIITGIISFDTASLEDTLQRDTLQDMSFQGEDTLSTLVGYNSKYLPDSGSISFFYIDTIRGKAGLVDSIFGTRQITRSYIRKITGDTLLVLQDTVSFSIPERITQSDSFVVREREVKKNGPFTNLTAQYSEIANPLTNIDITIPDTNLPVVSFDSTDFCLWNIDTLSLPGSYTWDRETHEVSFSLPLPYFPDTIFLNTVAGEIFLLGESGNIFRLPYNVHHRFQGFIPSGSSIEDFWRVPQNEDKFTENTGVFALTSDISGNDPLFDDSLSFVSSRFQLENDFQFDLRLDLPANRREGYTVALFVSEDSIPAALNFGKGFEVISPGTGVYFHMSSGVDIVYAFSYYYDQRRIMQNIPLDVVFRLERKNKDFSISWDRFNTEVFEEFYSVEHHASRSIPSKLYLHLLLGNHTSKNEFVTIEWDSFVIHQGKVILP
ncbi:MAG: hypothetical protein HQK83_02615 [Fibrobacteria bacterium]|nr:hypothetical protein [Fibrobacteria bacterium]